ncbi:MAG TPA: penicillin acylase family protein [Bacilli bacterium]|nr:penicillin acylase family protein [Bacilli bacterium]
MKGTQGKKWLHLCLSVTVSCVVLFGASRSFGALPALADTLNPVQGVFTAADHTVAQTKTLQVTGLQSPVRIKLEADGTPHIRAERARDAWLAIGYLQAEERLFQMDMMRRQGRGLLAEVLGPDGLESDIFQRQLGLTQTAEAEWQNLTEDSEDYEMLTAFSQGVNAVIEEKKADHELPLMFHMLGYEPQPWTPQDSLVLKGVMTQMLSLSITPVYYSILAERMGEERVQEFFPVLPVSEQHPYAKGPYAKAELDPMPISAAQVLNQGVVAERQSESQPVAQAAGGQEEPDTANLLPKGLAAAGLDLLDRLNDLPSYAIHRDSNSNGWVVAGSKTVSGQPILAGDPHLGLSLPTIWFPMDVEAPGLHYQGVAIPGLPLVMIGRNDQVAWTITNGQNPQTFYYRERMDEEHPDQYFYKGAWRSLDLRTESIPVKGQEAEQVVVKSSIHGPIVTRAGVTLALDWIGAIPSHSLHTLLELVKAQDHQEFRTALKQWQAPSLNFVYADRQGAIGIIGAGMYPVFAAGKPWMPLDGTGGEDIVGAIPFELWPQADGSDGDFLGSANQLQVESDYPYYMGTTWYFDPGQRINRITEELAKPGKVTPEQMGALQNDVQDDLAGQLVPRLLQALQGRSLNETEQQVVAELSNWDQRMTVDSTGATMWWVFWDHYLHATFDPWWEKYDIPFKEHDDLAVQPAQPSLTQNLLHWTLDDPSNANFSNPITGETRTADQVMVTAFREAVQQLTDELGPQTDKWTWDRWHVREIPALTGIPTLGYGPKGAGGDLFTLNVAGVTHAVHGPSWRMVIDWGDDSMIATYPGGQSENPLSPWYQNRLEEWWNGQYRPFVKGAAVSGSDGVTWTLNPDSQEKEKE